MTTVPLYDLIVLVADTDAERTVETLLAKRHRSLGIRQIRFDLVRHPGRDAGTFKSAPEILRAYVGKAQHALVILDHDGSGQEKKTASEIEVDLEGRLGQNGWDNTCRAIVLDPELEVWVWSQSKHVARVLGFTDEQLREFLQTVVLDGDTRKPKDPKGVLEAALRLRRQPRSARLYQALAENVSLDNVNERAFSRFRDTLQKWFPLA